MRQISGDSATDYKGTLFGSGNSIVYMCETANATICIFEGIVFY